MENKNAWVKYPEGKERDKVMGFANEYRKFISKCKTERECVDEFEALAKAAGFTELKQRIQIGEPIMAGEKIYVSHMGKAMALFVIGKQSLENGMNILGAHIDSPRLDLKQVPLYEDTEMAMFDTHYYGGVKKYQWVTMPLAIHGVFAKKDGSVTKVSIGDKPEDPVFGISDLLIHLSGEQLEKKAAKVIEGEKLDLLIGSIPLDTEQEKEEAKETVKKNILRILEETYQIKEEDFLSAELEVVPAEHRERLLRRHQLRGADCHLQGGQRGQAVVPGHRHRRGHGRAGACGLRLSLRHLQAGHEGVRGRGFPDHRGEKRHGLQDVYAGGAASPWIRRELHPVNP